MNPIPDSDVAGVRFGMLTVIGYSHTSRANDGTSHRLFKCLCDCGNISFLRISVVTTGSTRSCGCLAIAVRRSKFTHGATRGGVLTPEYKSWRGMVTRCHGLSYHPKHEVTYRKKGVSVCDKWRYDFKAFLEDMGNKPSQKHTLDRYPNQTGNYEPGNVRWATMKQQMANKTNNVLVTANGITMTMCEWGEITGLGGECIRHRLKRGWREIDAVSIGKGTTRSYKTKTSP